jgi:hypothetical protein
MATQRICIFCGESPENKNKEHPLPQWLLTLTGDPKRVVRHGYRWSDGKFFEFSFDSLVFPACASCNTNYSGFEGYAKSIVEKICRKEPASPVEYVHLLDWLDKVRIGLWLGHRYLQQHTLTRHARLPGAAPTPPTLSKRSSATRANTRASSSSRLGV